MNKKIGALSIFLIFILGCSFLASPTVTPSPVPPSQTPQIPTAIPPTSTLVPPTQPALLGTVALDFVALLCDAQWMSGAQHLTACPNPDADHSGGYAVTKYGIYEGLSANTPVLLMFAGNNSAALFLRYPTIKVHGGDHFQATLRCQMNAPCDVQFALEYYDIQGKYHSPFYQWNYKTTYETNDHAIDANADLSFLAGQSIDFVLALRPQNGFLAQTDGGLWIAPYIYRPFP